MKPRAAAPARRDASLEFFLRLSRAWAMSTRRIDNALAGVHGLGFNDFMILYHLMRAPMQRLRRTDLAERLGVTASGVTRSLLPLEKIGLVTREPDARDARIGYAQLSAAGQRLLEHAMVSVRPVTEEALAMIDPGQVEDLSAALAKLAGINLSNE